MSPSDSDAVCRYIGIAHWHQQGTTSAWRNAGVAEKTYTC